MDEEKALTKQHNVHMKKIEEKDVGDVNVVPLGLTTKAVGMQVSQYRR